MDIKKYLRKIYEIFVISKCPACGEIVKYSGTLCENCQREYDKEKETPCPFCEMTADVCVCSTRGLRYCRDLGRSMCSLFFYSSKNPVLQKIIFALKHSPDRNAEIFLARELSGRIMRIIIENGGSIADWRVTYPPRSRKSKAEFGFDHAKQLARGISLYTGMKFETVFTHRGNAVQKKLSRSERAENANISFGIKKNVAVKGNRYIIIDDVITSGSTVKICQQLLLKNKAAAAFPVSVSKTVSRGEGFDREVNKKSNKECAVILN